LLSYFELATSDSSYLALLEPLLDKALFYHPNDPSFHALSGDLYYQSNQMDLAYKSYLKALDFGASDYFIWNRCLLIGLELQLYKEVIDLGDRAIQMNPIQPMLYLLTGLAYSIDKRYDNAILVLNKGLKYVVNNKPLRAEFYSYLGDAYHSLALHKLSDESYEKSLTLQPDNPVVLNNYSYYLSLREVNLEKAEQLSKACNELIPDQANYQDTYGWILYKLGMHSKSLEWLRNALLNSNSASSVIMEHYADALYQNGLKEEAVQFWRKAISLGGDSPLLLKKAKDEALYE
jgi:tetratricopeptide (TPR) repeat protein